MKNILFLSCLTVAALLLAGCAIDAGAAGSSRPTNSQTVTGPATAWDGDTVDVGGKRIDLWGVDAPNLVNSDGWYARAALDDLIGRNGTLACIIKDTSGTRDSGVCTNAGGDDIGRAMLLAGWAVVSRSDTSKRNADSALARAYADAESTARNKRAGLWGGMPRR